MTKPTIIRELDPFNPDGVTRRAIVAGGFPVAPPREWFENPGLTEPTPLTVTADGRVYGHIAAWSARHIGLPGQVNPPRSRSNYAYFKTGVVACADGSDVEVGQLTLAGGHAPLSADARRAVEHYDNTASAAADVNAGEDDHGIWVAGSVRPDVTDVQVRTLRASAPSGDWRPIGGSLELVACCQVNVPGFPTLRARREGGQITSMVAAGALDMAMRRVRAADHDYTGRLGELESVVASLVDSRKDELRGKVHAT